MLDIAISRMLCSDKEVLLLCKHENGYCKMRITVYAIPANDTGYMIVLLYKQVYVGCLTGVSPSPTMEQALTAIVMYAIENLFKIRILQHAQLQDCSLTAGKYVLLYRRKCLVNCV